MPPALHLSRRNELVAKNTGLVYAVIRSVGVEPSAAVYDDCVQEGLMGLSRAAERFKASFGVAFSTFAWRWVAGAVKTCLCRSSIVTEPVRRVSRRAAENARARSLEGRETHPRVTSYEEGERMQDRGGGSNVRHVVPRLPECLIHREAESDLVEELDMKALNEAIAELPRAEREVIKAALRGTPVSHYARRRGWSRDRTSTLLRQATETLRARMAEI